MGNEPSNSTSRHQDGGNSGGLSDSFFGQSVLRLPKLRRNSPGTVPEEFGHFTRAINPPRKGVPATARRTFPPSRRENHRLPGSPSPPNFAPGDSRKRRPSYATLVDATRIARLKTRTARTTAPPPSCDIYPAPSSQWRHFLLPNFHPVNYSVIFVLSARRPGHFNQIANIYYVYNVCPPINNFRGISNERIRARLPISR